MRISDNTIEKILKQGGILTESQLADLKTTAERSKRTLQETIIEDKVLEERELAKLVGDYIGTPFVEIEPKDIPDEVLKRIPEHIARQYNVVLFAVDEDGAPMLAMEDPDDVQALNFIQKEIGYNLRVFLATKSNILDCLENYRGDVNDELDEVIAIQRDDSDAENAKEEEFAEDSPIAQTVNLLLEYAIKSHASDIHIEPREEFVQVRYRIDGVLREVNKLPHNVLGALVSRIKILSNLKIDERRVPQDGRFKIKVSGKQYALRVSTLPIADGEKIVMRVLDESNQAISLEKLGYWGLSDVNISTIEDPVEYKIPGVNQTQTNAKAGMTFASGLRALLRQDPNIIMVGEIRDGETANLGVQAALTGHLVFSTLHTNNAATCLPRLLDMDIEPFLIASTVKAVIGQRLVRRLCQSCRQAYTPSQEELNYITQMFNITPESMPHLHELEEQAASESIGGDTPMGTTDATIVQLWKPSPEGCDECGHNGFKGRVGIYEVLGISVAIQKMITANATSNDIQEQAISEGMITMQMDGLIKSFRGVTTIEEILRATREQ